MPDTSATPSINVDLRLADKGQEQTKDVILPGGELVAYLPKLKIDRVYGSVREIVNDDTDVYSLDAFPQGPTGSTVLFSPKDVFNAIEDYGTSPDSFPKVMGRHGINSQSVRVFMRRYTQIQEHYARAQKMKADVLIDSTFEIAADSSGDVIAGEGGKPVINNANVRRSELKIKNNQFYAERLNSKYMAKQGVESKSLNVHTNINLPNPHDMQALDINELGQVFGK